MASSYALPVSALQHNHLSSHSHTNSHSHTPRANHSRSLKQERSIGSSHSHAQSESHLPHIHEHEHDHHGHSHDHNHNHNHNLNPNPSPYPLSPISNSADSVSLRTIVDEKYEQAQFEGYQPPINIGDHSHGGHERHARSHNHDHHIHKPSTPTGPRSRVTSFLLPYVLQWPLIHTIISDKDSRRIFYFMSLNFAFMIVQATYGFLTDSLGLLSDSIHMFFDCFALMVGLFASVASRWPASERFPYGFGKIETLSGFGNAVFLMLISVEIITEATERLTEGRETKRLLELFVVSTMGLAVNLVGMAAFGHHGHHHGHDHGHEGHDHAHSHGNSHADHSGHDHRGHDHGHDSHTSPFSNEKAPAIVKPHAHAHGHSHDNENMIGIYLHVLADTMGSAAVIVSTGLIYFTGWNGWDPLASCVIAVLIFMSSIPLLKSSAKNLLLTVPDTVEYNLRDSLGGIAELRGVHNYTVPRFWLGDQTAEKGVQELQGAIHIVASHCSELEEVRERVRSYLLNRGLDIVVQVEKKGDTSCWCGSGRPKSSPFA
ncbi:cation efflux family-domain-containing protein [Calycina marina]|uniref:Zinc transporter n=1 Tax=Calycina marina TaxID=1763456 RepID=A0A9P8CGI8_9HELO|nr:cation efflux family-domain-containing protein [Calycina marina]